ncbi:MAG: hypothetical protein NZ898_08780 [Myxococcota bacterium]|nr:hypothetical protein [Myxococcota bacterium]MDW8361719.1 hypothetical protein [Myxococcales bacterium]
MNGARDRDEAPPSARGCGPSLVLLAAAVPMLALALALRGTPEGTVSLAAFVGLLGASATYHVRTLRELVRLVPRPVGWLAGVAVLAWVAADVWWDAIARQHVFETFDWPIHHALVEAMREGLERGAVPRWVMDLSTGDSPFELYPSLTPRLVAELARWLGPDVPVPKLLVGTAVGAHLALAIAVFTLARRVAPGWLALVAALAAILDAGSVVSGGIVALFHFALLHQGIGLALGAWTLVCILSYISSPRVPVALAVWVLAAIAGVAHPLMLLSHAALAAALVLGSLVPTEVPRARMLGAALHVLVGTALGAVEWLPYALRLAEHGVVYPMAPWPLFELTAHALTGATAEATFRPLVAAGLLAALLAIGSRRGPAVVLGGVALLLVLATADTVWLELGLAPSRWSASLALQRLAAPAKIALWPLSAWLLARLFAVTAGTSVRARTGSCALIGALAALLLAFGARGASAWYVAHRDWARGTFTARWNPDPGGFEALTAWLRDEQRRVGSDRCARLLAENGQHWVHQIALRSGVPVFYVGPIPMLFLRERLESPTPEQLQQFCFRWALRHDRPPSFGAEETERRFGMFYVRELPSWDGAFARIARGEGQLRVLARDDERVVLEIEAREPVLVTLATGYYPRWRAFAGGAYRPAVAVPVAEGARSHLLGFELPPGRAEITCDAPLPSDDAGWPVALAGAFAAVGWALGRMRRVRGLVRRAALVRRIPWPTARTVGLAGLGALGVAAAASWIARREAPAEALVLSAFGSMRTRVEASVRGAPWRPCEYTALSGWYTCEGAGRVLGTMATVLRDHPASWPWLTPAVRVYPLAEQTAFRIRSVRRLGGSYVAGVDDARATAILSRGDEPPIALDGWTELDFGETAPRELSLEIRPHGRQPVGVALVRSSHLRRDRDASESRAPKTALTFARPRGPSASP